MGLIGGMARTAVVAGTATAVSNRVSRRQANKWAAHEQPQQPQQPQQPAYQEPPPPAYAPPPPPPPAADEPDMLEQLQKLGELRAAGVLTEAEFAAQKAKILAQ
jgi:hypothetical protein